MQELLLEYFLAGKEKDEIGYRNPDIRINQAIAKSKEMMIGNKWMN